MTVDDDDKMMYQIYKLTFIYRYILGDKENIIMMKRARQIRVTSATCFMQE